MAEVCYRSRGAWRGSSSCFRQARLSSLDSPSASAPRRHVSITPCSHQADRCWLPSAWRTPLIALLGLWRLRGSPGGGGWGRGPFPATSKGLQAGSSAQRQQKGNGPGTWQVTAFQPLCCACLWGRAFGKQPFGSGPISCWEQSRVPQLPCSRASRCTPSLAFSVHPSTSTTAMTERKVQPLHAAASTCILGAAIPTGHCCHQLCP